MTAPNYTICLDTNVVWDLARYRSIEERPKSERESIASFRQTAEWLASIGAVSVFVAPFTVTEFHELVRDDLHANLLMQRKGESARGVAASRKHYRRMEPGHREDAYEIAKDTLEHLRRWFKISYRLRDPKTFSARVLQLLKKSSLSLPDIYIWAAAWDRGANCFVSADGDFGNAQKELRDIVGTDVFFLNHLHFVRTDEDRPDVTSRSGNALPPDAEGLRAIIRRQVKRRPLRGELLRRVFFGELPSIEPNRVGNIFGLSISEDQEEILLYHHTSKVTPLSVGDRIAIHGDSHSRRLRVAELEQKGEPVQRIICPPDKKQARGGIRVESDTYSIADPEPPSDGDGVFLDSM